MSELILVFAACACSLLWAGRHARRLAMRNLLCREIERLLAAVQRACGDFFWREARLMAVALAAIAAIIGLLLVLGVDEPPPRWAVGRGLRPVLVGSGIGLCLGAAAGAVLAGAAHWIATRTSASALSQLRRGAEEAGSEGMRGAAVIALLTDASSLLLTLAVFVAHYAYASLVGDAATALAFATQSLPATALGACCAAAVFQIGGSSFHTAAGVASAAARSRYEAIGDDEEQNPALVAELVGEYAGGVVSRSLDGFAALVLVNAGSVLAAATLARANVSSAAAALGLTALPLVVRAIGIFASTVALGSLRFDGRVVLTGAVAAGAASHAVVAATGLLGATFWLLGGVGYGVYFLAGALGIVAGFVSLARLAATRFAERELPVEEVQSSPGEASSIARALALGLQQAWLPLLGVGICLGGAYFLGLRSPLERGGQLALVIAVCAMLGAGALHLAQSLFSSVIQGIARIAALRRSGFDAEVRSRADALLRAGVSVGNLGHTQSILGSASAALLVAMMLPSLLEPARANAAIGGLGHPVVLLGGLLGAGSVLFYVGSSLRSATRAASALDQNLRSRLDATVDAGVPVGAALPSYRISVQLAATLSTQAILPLALTALLTPFALGALLRIVYGGGVSALATQGLMAFGSVAALTGCSAALAAQGTLNALAASKQSAGCEAPAPRSEAATEFIGRCVQPAALFGLKAAVVASLIAAPLLS